MVERGRSTSGYDDIVKRSGATSGYDDIDKRSGATSVKNTLFPGYCLLGGK